MDTTQHNLPAVEPALLGDGNLNVVVPPDGDDMGDGDNIVDMSMGSPCQMEKETPDSLQQG